MPVASKFAVIESNSRSTTQYPDDKIIVNPEKLSVGEAYAMRALSSPSTPSTCLLRVQER